MNADFETTEVPGSADVTPLENILPDEPGGAVASDPAPADEAVSSEAGDSVPLGVLKRVRERQKRDAAKVRALEQEIEQYRAEKFEYDDDSLGIDDAAPADADAPISESRARYVENYRRLEAELGPSRIGEINAALGRLTPSQQDEVNELAAATGDPHVAISYMEQVGALYRRPSLDEALRGEPSDPRQAPEANADASALQERQSALEARERHLAEAASQLDFANTHGLEALASLDAAVGEMMQTGHPLLPQLQQIFRSAQHPASAVAAALSEWGVWRLPSAQPQRQVMPTNFAGSRNVGPRSGPAWSGPTSLGDIFARGRPSA